MVLSELTPPDIQNREIVHNNKSWWLIDTGVPHLITFDADINNFDIEEARELRYKYNCNVNIASIINDSTIKVRTYERGVENETLACGTGMASAYYRALQENLVKKETLVLPKSDEKLYLGFENGTITFKGLVKATFTTTWN
jgi:diaminopimelate epimerase